MQKVKRGLFKSFCLNAVKKTFLGPTFPLMLTIRGDRLFQSSCRMFAHVFENFPISKSLPNVKKHILVH